MATPNPLYYMCPSLQDYFVDKDNGAPLSAGVVTFYKDNDHNTLKSVYQQVRSPSPPYDYQFVALPNPMVLSSVGTFLDNNGADIIPYFYPWENAPGFPTGNQDLYYITVESTDGVPQFTREAWPPNAADNPNTSETFVPTTNLLSNPQFVEVLFSGSTSIPVTGTNTVTEIAPDWAIITSGSGNVVVQQVPIIDNPLESNPPYVLDIQVPALSAPLLLRQRLQNSPRLLADNYMAGYFIVASQDGANHDIGLNYLPYGLTAQLICEVTTTSTGDYLAASGTVEVDTVSLVPADIGYLDIYISIPASSHIRISSIQAVGVANITSSAQFIQESAARQKDHLYHYWEPSLKAMPISSFLTGWDFILNPVQWGASIGPVTVGGTNTAFYAWDQTIIHQQVDASVVVSLNTGGEMAITPNTTTQIGIIQYLAKYKCKDVLRAVLYGGVSSAVKMSAGQDITINVSIWYTKNASLPVLTNPAVGFIAKGLSFVQTMSGDGHPETVVAGWIEIPLVIPYKQTQTITGDYIQRQIDFAFWQANLSLLEIVQATYFAIFVGTSAINNGTVLYLDSIALVPGVIPTLPAPQSQDQVLRECQYYFEHSYEILSSPVPIATSRNAAVFPLSNNTSGIGVTTVYPEAFTINYAQEKIVIPTVALYPSSGVLTAGNVYVEANYTGGPAASTGNIVASTAWNQRFIGTRSVSYTPANKTAIYTVAGTTGGWGFVEAQYVLDARLGVV